MCRSLWSDTAKCPRYAFAALNTLEDDYTNTQSMTQTSPGVHLPEILRSFPEQGSQSTAGEKKGRVFFVQQTLYIVMAMKQGAHTLSSLRSTDALMSLFAHVNTCLLKMFRS